MTCVIFISANIYEHLICFSFILASLYDAYSKLLLNIQQHY